MPRLIELTPTKTYATAENAIKAVKKVFGEKEIFELRYMLMQTPEGRWYPVFLGQQGLQHGAHFHFCVIG